MNSLWKYECTAHNSFDFARLQNSYVNKLQKIAAKIDGTSTPGTIPSSISCNSIDSGNNTMIATQTSTNKNLCRQETFHTSFDHDGKENNNSRQRMKQFPFGSWLSSIFDGLVALGMVFKIQQIDRNPKSEITPKQRTVGNSRIVYSVQSRV